MTHAEQAERIRHLELMVTSLKFDLAEVRGELRKELLDHSGSLDNHTLSDKRHLKLATATPWTTTP